MSRGLSWDIVCLSGWNSLGDTGQKIEQNSKTSKLNSEAESKSAFLQMGLKSPNISKKSLPEGIWSKKVTEHAFLKSHILPQNLLISQNCD